VNPLYWSIVALVLGGCIGSFVNVVIYRWPRDLSIHRPSRSFCPACEQPIAWYDNIPVLSYLVLRGRCRRCHAAISVRYPLVELATALVFLLTYDAFFVARQRIGIGNDLAGDGPMLIAHWALWAGLIALAVMDLEAYLVDIRVTWVIAGAGLLGHVLWRPAPAGGWIRPSDVQAGFTLAAVVGLALGAFIFLRRTGESEPAEEAPAEEANAGEISPDPTAGRLRLRWMGVIVPAALVVVYLVAMTATGEQEPLRAAPPQLSRLRLAEQPAGTPLDTGMIRLGIGLAMLFVGLALAASHPQPEADSNIVEAIWGEASDARRNALQELKLLAPAILLSTVVLALLVTQPAVRDRLSGWIHWTPVDGWQPVSGLTVAITGWVLGGAVGWLARIGFTLLFGKEALGMGDVHILAAAGAVAGWPVALLGFFLAAPLTLSAILVIHLRRQSRALPYGPWLALAFLIASVFQDRILIYLGVR